MEKLYHYVWKHRMLGSALRLRDTRKVTVLDPGRLNNDAGPDFFNAKILIDGTEWAGNIEIHVKASDWHRHGHDSDPAYDGVILHVVAIDDCEISRSDGKPIPQLVISLPEDFYKTYSALDNSTFDRQLHAIRCATHIGSLSPLAVTDWLETLSIERLQTKARRIADIIDSNGGDWEQACFITLARALGFGLNSEPFERTARSLPLKTIHRHSDHIDQVESLLFGQAGMLDTSQHILDEYYQHLAHEYFFLARKYGLRGITPGGWKYARTRPQNFPHRRIAWLASLMSSSQSIHSKIIDTEGDIESLRKLFNAEVSQYWKTHHSFDTDEGKGCGNTLGPQSIDLLLINVASPIFYAYGSMTGNYDLAEKGHDILRALASENNSITRRWKSLGIEADDATRSQALIHLTRQYCDEGKCLFCRFGHALLRKTIPTALRAT